MPTLEHTLTALSWLLPIAVYAIVRRFPSGAVEGAIAIVMAAGGAALVWRWPQRALLILVAVLPFQLVILSFLYQAGVPAPLVRGLAGYRDVILVGLILVAVLRSAEPRAPLDGLDKLAIAYVALVTAYLVVPNLFVGQVDGRGAPSDFEVRLLSYRANVGFVLLMLAARRLPASKDLCRRLARVVLVGGLIVAAATLFEFFFSNLWNDIAVKHVGVTRYEREILGTFHRPGGDVRAYMFLGGRQLVRPGSVFYDPISAGFYLVVPLGVALAMAARRSLSRAYVALPLLGVGLLLSYVRSAVIAGVVMTVLSLRRGSEARVRLALVLGVGAVFMVFAAVGSGFTARIGGDNGPGENSNELHVQAFERGLDALRIRPLGSGLGSEPGISDRFATGTKIVTENAYLQVGTTLGIPAMVLFVVMLVALLRRLAQARDSALEDDPLAAALRPAGIGLAIGGLFLHIWLGLAMAMTFWGGAGLIIGVSERRASRRSGRRAAELLPPA
jgi:hypothetical protein